MAAYKRGALPMKKGAVPTDAPSAEAYLAQREELKKQIAERTRREQAIKDPSSLLESDLTNHRLIDNVFIANIGPGSGSMVLAGITVRKHVWATRATAARALGGGCGSNGLDQLANVTIRKSFLQRPTIVVMTLAETGDCRRIERPDLPQSRPKVRKCVNSRVVPDAPRPSFLLITY